MSKLEMYWLEMLPGILIVPPLSVDLKMWIGGHPVAEVSRLVPRVLSASVSGFIGRSLIRFWPVIITFLLRAQAKLVKNLVAVPALPKLILPGDADANFLSPCCM